MTISDSIRDNVRKRANERCEYCLRPDFVDTYTPQVDHIRPRKHDGADTLNNLAWACFHCNNAKGSDMGSYDEITDELTPFFNPRTQMWDDHFEIIEGVIAGTTAVGRVTVRLFQMNHPKMIDIRRDLIEAGLW